MAGLNSAVPLPPANYFDTEDPYAGTAPYQPVAPVAASGPVFDYGGSDSQIARGIRSAFSGAKASLQGFGGMGAELVGADEYAQQLYADAVASQQAAEAQAPRVRTIRQVMESDNPLSSGVDYLAGTVGQVTPYMLLGGAGGLVGRGVGLASGLRAGLSGEALAARAATGAGWGGTAAIHPVMAGDQAAQLQQDPAAAGMSVGERALRANAVGALQAGANALAPAAMVNQTFARGAQQALVPRILGNMALGGVGEGAEDVVGQLHRADYDPNYRFDPEQTGENFAAGFFGAAPVAGLHGVATHTAHGAADAVVDGAKALGAGAQWVGEQAYQNMPPQVQKTLDTLAAGGQATVEAAKEMEPYIKALGRVGGMTADAFMNRINSITKEDSAKGVATKTYAGAIEAAATAYKGLSGIGGKVADKVSDHVSSALDEFFSEAKNDPEAATVRANTDVEGKTELEKLSSVADAMSNLEKWVDEKTPMTVQRVRSIESMASNEEAAHNFTKRLLDYVDETGLDTDSTRVLRDYAARMDERAGDLTVDEMKDLWIRAHLVTQLGAQSEALDELVGTKRFSIRADDRGNISVAAMANKESSGFNKAIRAAMSEARVDQKFADSVADRIQLERVIEDGAEQAVREAVTGALASHGIRAKANQHYTNIYNAVLPRVKERIEMLRKEGYINDDAPAIAEMKSSLPDGFRKDVKDVFIRMIADTPAGREMISDPRRVVQHLEGLIDFTMRAARGAMPHEQIAHLRAGLEKLYGERGAQSLNEIIKLARAAVGDGEAAENLSRLADTNEALLKEEADLRKMVQTDIPTADLLKHVVMARDFDARRQDLLHVGRRIRAEMKTLDPNDKAQNERLYSLRKQHEQAQNLFHTADSGKVIREQWVKDGIVSERNAERLFSAVMRYGRLQREDMRPSHIDQEGGQYVEHEKNGLAWDAEDLNDYERAQAISSDSYDENGRELDEPIPAFNVAAKFGRDRQDYIDKIRTEKYGHTLDNTRTPPQFFGVESLQGESPAHGKVTAPLSRHPSGDRSAGDVLGSEWNHGTDNAHAKFGHRLVSAHGVSPIEWANEMAPYFMKKPKDLLNKAMKALLAHDQERLKSEKLTAEDITWIENRRKLADELAGDDLAGLAFFEEPMNRNYRYYRMERGDASNMSYSLDWLERAGGGLKTVQTADGKSTQETVQQFVTRKKKADGDRAFADKVYKKSLLRLRLTDDSIMTVDLPKLVQDAMRAHQPAETTGLNEKGVERDLSKELSTAVNNVLSTLLLTDGVKGIVDMFEGVDAEHLASGHTMTNTHFDPDLVVLRATRGGMKQGDEHVLSHSVRGFKTLANIQRVQGIDFSSLKTILDSKEGEHSPGKFTKQDMDSFFLPSSRGDDETTAKEKAALGIVQRGIRIGKKYHDVDLHALLARMLERNGNDAYQALREKSLPIDMAGMLMREGLKELSQLGHGGELFKVSVDGNGWYTYGFPDRFNDTVVYTQDHGSYSKKITLGDLRKVIDNPQTNTPRKLRDAQLQELRGLLEKRGKVEEDQWKRIAEGKGDPDDLTGIVREQRDHATGSAMNKLAYEMGQPLDSVEYETMRGQAGSRMRRTRINERGKEGFIDEWVPGDQQKHSVEEMENARIGQLLRELKEGNQGEVPLFDATLAYGGGGVKARAYGDPSKSKTVPKRADPVGLAVHNGRNDRARGWSATETREGPDVAPVLGSNEVTDPRRASLKQDFFTDEFEGGNLPVDVDRQRRIDQIQREVYGDAGKPAPADATPAGEFLTPEQAEKNKKLTLAERRAAVQRASKDINAPKTKAALERALPPVEMGAPGGSMFDPYQRLTKKLPYSADGPKTLAERRAEAKMTVETLAHSTRDVEKTTREDAAIKARAALRDEIPFATREELDAHQSLVDKTNAEGVTFEKDEPAPAPAAKTGITNPFVDRLAKGAKIAATKYVNSLDDATLRDVVNRLHEAEDGTVAAELRDMLEHPSGTMAQWVEETLQRAGADVVGGKLITEEAHTEHVMTREEASADTNSAEWLKASEARWISQYDTADLNDYLKGVEAARGKEVADELRDMVASVRREEGDGRMYNKETPGQRGEEATLEEIKAEVRRLMGAKAPEVKMELTLKAPDGSEVSAAYSDAEGILISAIAADRMNKGQHEVWHAVEKVLSGMGEHGQKILSDVHKFVSSPLMKRWLNEKYGANDGVRSQLEDPRERAAYTFQAIMKGEKVPPIDKTTFMKVRDWIRGMMEKLGFGTTTGAERAESFLDYVKRGEFGRDVENAASVRRGLGEKNGDNLMRLVADTMKPAMEGLEKVFEHTSRRVEKLGISEYDEIVKKFAGEEGKGGYRAEQQRMLYKFANRFAGMLEGKNKEEREALFRRNGLDSVLNGKDGVFQYMIDAGVPEKQAVGMFRQMFTANSDLVESNFEGFVTDLEQHGGFKGKPGEARQAANDIVDRGYFYDPDIKLFEGRPDLAEKWADRDPLERMLRFTMRATRIAERVRAFGQVKEFTAPDGSKYKMEEGLNELLTKGDVKAGAEGRKLVRDYIAAMEGKYGGRLSPAMKKLYGGLMFAMNVHILPAMVFSQMLEPMQLALRKNSLSGSMDSLFRGIRDLPRTFEAVNKRVAPDYWEKLAYQVGSAPTRIITSVMQELMNGVVSGGTIGEMNNHFFRLNGMEQWNRSMHVEATRHAVEFLREHKENVEQGKGETDKGGGLRSERFLRELNVKASDIQFNKAGELVLNDKVERAIVQWVEEAMAHPDAGSNPLWMNDPRWALISQMKRFTFATAKFVLGRGMKELKLGNAFPVAPAMLAMPWMMAADGLRDFVQQNPGHQAKSTLDYAMHAMERANLFGRGQFGLDTLDAVGRGGSPVEALGGPTVEMFGNIARGAHNGQLIDTLIDYSPAGGLINALS